MNKRESAIEAYICRKLKAAGVPALKFVSPGTSGMPDRIVLIPGGSPLFVELKAASGTLSKRQEVCIQRLRGLGYSVRVVQGMQQAARLVNDVCNRAERNTNDERPSEEQK